MKRRHFLRISSGVIAAAALDKSAFSKNSGRIDAAWYQRSRRFVELPVSRVITRARLAALFAWLSLNLSSAVP
jgi:hypothetical protein